MCLDPREVWLIKAAELMRPWFKQSVPPIRVSVGWSSKGSRSKRIGEHWHPRAATDGVSQIFISPVLDNPEEALSTLLHEMIHAIVPDDGHGKLFKRIALDVGFMMPMRSTPPSPELKSKLNELLTELGPYPHAKLNLGDKSVKKQTTRLIKIECPSCGYTVRAAKSWIDQGMPICSICSEEFGVAV